MEMYDDVNGGQPGSSLIRTLLVGGAAFLVGLLIGLVVLGWGLFPVQWEDAAPRHLRADYRETYLRMAIDSYSLRPDDAQAQKRLAELGEAAPEVLATVAANPGEQSPEVIAAFQAAVGGVSTQPVEGTGQPAAEEQPSTDGGGLFSARTVLILLCGVTFLVAGALGVIYLLRTRRRGGEPSAAVVAQEYSRQAEQTDFEALGEAQPLAQWMTTYVQGDDLFDDSFSIDSPTGEFMGECGVGIADTIGVGDPKRVTAFEVWLFDKNDIQTVTKVLMSTHAFNDDALRERLAAKGEPILANPGQEVVLETETLQMVARVVDMTYGEGALPDQSFFDRVTVELAVWANI